MDFQGKPSADSRTKRIGSGKATGAGNACLLRMGAALLVTLAAKNRPALGQFEGHGGFLAALRTDGGRDLALPCRPICAIGSGTARLAPFASLGVVPEAFLRVKELLAGGKHKIGTAFNTFQDSVPVLHQAAPLQAVGTDRVRVHRSGGRAGSRRSSINNVILVPSWPSCERACELRPL